MAAVRALRDPEALAGPGGIHGVFASRTGLLRPLRAPPACPPRDVSSTGFTRLRRAITQRAAARGPPEQRSLSGCARSPSAAGSGGAALPALGARSGATGKTGSGHRVRAGRCLGGRRRLAGASAGRPCPEPDFAGGSGCACPWSAPAGVSKETWAAVCAAEPPHSHGRREARPPGQFCSPQLGAQDAAWQGDQLSSQLYRNKQLQDTLLQKEEELARLHEENNNLRQYLNSALIKCLEEKAKKLLSDHGQKTCAILRSTKRRLKEDHCFVPQETPHASKARRNLFNEFTACEEQASPAVDSWVLQTLGLKDVNTIDEASANYSALSPDLGKDTYCLSPGGAADYEHREGAAAVFSCSHVPPSSSSTHPCSQDSPFLPQFSSAPCISSPVPSVSSVPAYGLPYLTGGLSPNKTEVAFTTCLSPHRNVRTHSFHQGQAFVRRDDDGGWRFTWVPKQPE
ncbi:geminin coiled-coil domain-containing protein 1 [Haemorhous mexicanus]|uniref:geminin coiled-coil domain-containing protein 1 n=1 Tax=Haemorhous mexicanus TaxID=30427 RepID=UPI0028BDC3E8|nr:geminin coiled-coil domain-containing protein 1 [Haemorhous mexicanus]